MTIQEAQTELKTKDWYYVLTFAKGKNRSLTVIVFAKTKQEAIDKVAPWLVKEHQDGGVFYYKNNYKIEARNKVARGEYI